jgi:hypothetical protein
MSAISVLPMAPASKLSSLGYLSVALALSAGVFALCEAAGPDSYDLLNAYGPIVLAVCCLGGIVLLLRESALWMWSPLVAFLAAVAVFHGLGPLLHVFGDPVAIAYANQFSTMSSEELASTNLLSLAGTACVVAAFTLSGKLLKRRGSRAAGLQAKLAPGFVRVVTCSVIGIALPVKYFLVVPYLMGWTDTDFILAGVLQALSCLSPLCLFLLLYNAWSRSKVFYVPAAVLFVGELTTGLLLFNKTAVLTTLAIGFLGFYFLKPSKALALGGLLSISVVYLAITPIVSRGRMFLVPGSTSLSDRVQALNDAWDSNEEVSGRIPEGWWTRLCYSNAQAFCIRQYNAGIPGDTFGLIIPALIPRVLWPGKPIITAGYEFNQLVTGDHRSSSAAGIFGEAYWNGGWVALLLACVYIGALLSWFSQIAFDCVARRDLRWLPFGIGGMLMASSVTDWFASTYVGGALTYAVYLVCIRVMMPSFGGGEE